MEHANAELQSSATACVALDNIDVRNDIRNDIRNGTKNGTKDDKENAKPREDCDPDSDSGSASDSGSESGSESGSDSEFEFAFADKPSALHAPGLVAVGGASAVTAAIETAAVVVGEGSGEAGLGKAAVDGDVDGKNSCLLYTSPSPRD